MTATASTSSKRSPFCAAWNACAVPEKFAVMPAGSVAAADFTSATAPPRETPGEVLKLRVTAGSCPA